jgi:hypothetical protein
MPEPPTRRTLLGGHPDPDPPRRWQRPEDTGPTAVDAVEVGCVDGGVLVRTTLGPAIVVSGGAWAAFLTAIKRGEYDHTATS